MRPVEVFVAQRGNAFMRDIAGWIVEGAHLLGREAVLRDDGRLPLETDSLNLVVAPHELYPLSGLGDAAIDAAARISVPICTEQPGTTWFEVSTLLCRSSPAVVDINRHGVDAMRRRGLPADWLRLGGVPGMDRRTGDARPIELLFLGGRTPRRDAALAELAPLLWNRAVDLRMFTFSRPVRPGIGGLVFGDAKYDLLARSRVLLNLHRDGVTPGYFEWARMIEAMANGCCVVTEPSSGYEPLRPGVHFVESHDIAGTIAGHLDDVEAAAAIGERAAEAVLGELAMTETLRPLLDRLDRVAPRARNLLGRRYAAKVQRARQIPLLPAFRPLTDIRVRLFRALTAETLTQRRIDRAQCLLRHGRADHVERVESAAYATATPDVSVVVTLFDYAHLVGETLDSIAASVGIEYEIVVVDDHSTDGGREVVRTFVHDRPDVATVMLGSDVNRGLPASRNLAFAACRGEFVMVMDADNLVYPTALRRLADALRGDPEAAFAYSMLEEFGTSSGVRSAMGWHVPWLCEGNYIDAQAMIRATSWERHGGYCTDDELVFGWEDWELWLRLAAAGEHGVHVAQMLGRYRTQTSSMLSTTNLVADHMLRHLRELYPQLPWPDHG